MSLFRILLSKLVSLRVPLRLRSRQAPGRSNLFFAGLTLLELIIALAISAFIVLAIHNITVYTNFHVLTADRRAKAQNEASFCLEHMSKEIAKAIGNEKIEGVNNVVYISTDAVSAFIDYSGNGKRDASDNWIKYNFDNTKGSLYYCANCSDDATCPTCFSPGGPERLSDRIHNFTPSSNDNLVNINITACYDPLERKFACGSRDNPTANLTTRIKMPQVSVN